MVWSRRLFQILLPLACAALGLRLFFIQSLLIETDRLSPALERGDFILGFKGKDVQRGDFVTFNCLKRRLCVGRVLGFPGDHLKFEKGGVEINGDSDEAQTLIFIGGKDASRLNSEAQVVAPESYFMEGDEFGEVLASEVNSVLTRMLFSVDPQTRKVRWNKIWKAIH